MRKKTNRNDLVKAVEAVAREKWDYHTSDEERYNSSDDVAQSQMQVLTPALQIDKINPS